MSTRMVVIEGGVHDDLRQVLFSIFSSEQTVASGISKWDDSRFSLKYADGDRDALVKMLYGRNVRDHVLWLCHLIRAASHLEQGYHSLFFGPPAQAQSVKTLFQRVGCDANSRPISLSGGQLSVNYEDGAYILHLKYVNVLMALFELLLESDFDVVQPIVDQVASSARTQSEVVAHAKVLQRTLVNYLNRHLPSRQAARKQAALVDYIEQHADGALDSRSISDAHVLGFWQDAVERDVADFKTYASVVECFENLFEAVLRGQVLRQADQPVAVESGRDDWHGAEQGFATGNYPSADGEQIIQELRSARQQGIRYFSSDKQAKALQSLLGYRESIRHRPLTLLRYLVFGAHQSRISNTLRHQTQPGPVQELIEAGPSSSYQDRYQEYGAYVESLRQACIAVAHLLLSTGNSQVLYFLTEMLEDTTLEAAEELSGLSIQALLEANVDWGDIRSSAHELLIERCLELLCGDNAVGRAARDKLQQAFSRINRAGFSDDVADDAGMMSLHGEWASLLADALRLSDLALACLMQAPAQGTNWQSAYNDDKETFHDMFKRIYGDASW